MGQTLVSIIVPVYNAKATIAAAIESVLNQSLHEIELIIVDGGSTDGTIAVIETYRHSIYKFISEKDGGVYSAINKGIAHANGDWIYILGADDRLSKDNILQKIFSYETKNISLIIGNISNHNIQNSLVPAIHRSTFDWKILFRNTVHQQGAFYARKLFSPFKFEEQYKVLADYDFHLILYYNKTPYLQIDEVIAICGADGLSKKFNWSLYKEELKMKQKRLSLPIWFINIPIICLKFLLKKVMSVK